jgi:hypothetical protein
VKPIRAQWQRTGAWAAGGQLKVSERMSAESVSTWKPPPALHLVCPVIVAIPEYLLSTFDQPLLNRDGNDPTSTSLASRSMYQKAQRLSSGLRTNAQGCTWVLTPRDGAASSSKGRAILARKPGHREVGPGSRESSDFGGCQVAGWLRRHTSTTTAASARARPARASP